MMTTRGFMRRPSRDRYASAVGLCRVHTFVSRLFACGNLTRQQAPGPRFAPLRLMRIGGLPLTCCLAVTAADGEWQRAESNLADWTATPSTHPIGAGVQAFECLVDATNG